MLKDMSPSNKKNMEGPFPLPSYQFAYKKNVIEKNIQNITSYSHFKL